MPLAVRLFRRFEDFEAFRRVMVEAYRRHPLGILAYCILSNHWHFVVWPNADGQVTDYFRWLAHTHAMRCVGGSRTGRLAMAICTRAGSSPLCTAAACRSDRGDSQQVAHRASRRPGVACQHANEHRGVGAAAPEHGAGPPLRRRLDRLDSAASRSGAYPPAQRTSPKRN